MLKANNFEIYFYMRNVNKDNRLCLKEYFSSIVTHVYTYIIKKYSYSLLLKMTRMTIYFAHIKFVDD